MRMADTPAGPGTQAMLKPAARTLGVPYAVRNAP